MQCSNIYRCGENTYIILSTYAANEERTNMASNCMRFSNNRLAQCGGVEQGASGEEHEPIVRGKLKAGGFRQLEAGGVVVLGTPTAASGEYRPLAQVNQPTVNAFNLNSVLDVRFDADANTFPLSTLVGPVLPPCNSSTFPHIPAITGAVVVSPSTIPPSLLSKLEGHHVCRAGHVSASSTKPLSP